MVAALARVTARDRNSLGSTAGDSWVSDRRTAADAAAAPTAKEPSTPPLPQPQSPPWVMPSATAPTATDTRATPRRSGAGPPEDDSRRWRRAPRAAAAATGRFTKNAHRQPPASTRTEPSDGPVATARAEMPPHMAT